MRYFSPRKELFRINFHVENSRSDKTECTTCTKKLEKGEIRVVYHKIMVKSDYFHLNCFIPKSNQFILIEDVKMVLNESSMAVFKDWLDAWNANYFPLNRAPYCPNLSNIQKFEVRVQHRRIFLEVFKFLDVFDLVHSLSKVNKNFYTLIWEKELWEFLLARDFKSFRPDSSETDVKKTYVTCFYSNCIECKLRPDDETFSRCPMIKRTLCKNCLKLDKFRLINKTQIMKIYGINSDLVKVSWWTYDGFSKVTYRVLFEKGLMLFRNQRKAKVLEFLGKFCTNLEVLKSFEDLDVSLMDLKVMDNKYYDLELWKSDYQRVVRGNLFEKMFDFIRKGKELNFDDYIGEKQLMFDFVSRN